MYFLDRHNGDLDAIGVDRTSPHNRNVAFAIAVLNGLELSAKPRNNITGLSSDQKLGRASPGTTTKWHESPIRTKAKPSLWHELIRIFAPHILVPMHDVLIDLDYVALSDIDWRFSVGAAAEWKRGVFDAISNLHDAIWIQPVG